MHTVLRSASRQVVIGDDQPFCIIGERINPTGRKIFQEQLRAGDLSRIEIDVAQQVAGGAMVLDVNMGVPLGDEVALMIQAVKLIQSITDLPLCIDSSVIEALEAGLSTYDGKALVNSVTAEDERLEAILPARQAIRGGGHRAPQRRERDPRAAGAASRACPQDRRGRDGHLRHRRGGHRARPLGDAHRRGHHASS